MLLTAMLFLSMSAVTAFAEDNAPVEYISPIIEKTLLLGFETKSCSSYSKIKQTDSVWGTDGGNTWLLASGNIELSGVTVYGTVNLILEDGCTVTVTGSDGAGIYVPFGTFLNIFAQSGGTGKLTASGGISAITGTGAGIGAACGQSHGEITINGGIITANGGTGGAGIGGCDENGGNLVVNGGTVVANGNSGGAGIGGGRSGEGHNVVLQGGTVTATGADGGAGIGGGKNAVGRHTVVHGGTVTAIGSPGGAGIGGGINGSAYEIVVDGGEVTATGGDRGAGIGGGSTKSGYNITINGGKITANGGAGGAGIGGGGGVTGEVSGGQGYNITILGGTVYANAASGGAGIGGGKMHGTGYNIKITGGEVKAYSWDCGHERSGAGIGGGANGDGWDITISGGTVEVYGQSGAGIGGGYCCDGWKIYITGGNLRATAGRGALSIGCGVNSSRINDVFIDVRLQIKNEDTSEVIANNGGDLSSLMFGVNNMSVAPAPKEQLEPTVKLRFHGVDGVVTELELTPGAALEEAQLALPDPAFVGWYYDVNYTTQAQVGDVISADTELYLRETEEQTEYPYADASNQTGSGSVFGSGSKVILLGGCGLLVLAVGAVFIVSKKKKTNA